MKTVLVIVDEFSADKIHLGRLIGLIDDGPDFTKAVQRKLSHYNIETSSEFLLDINTCSLHIVHDSFNRGLKRCSHDVEEL